MTQTVAALFVDPRGIYAGLPDVDVWGIDRDARNYAGPHPVVAHPPCSLWCQMAKVNQARYGHRVGADDGRFASALRSVNRWGGVLEHPALTHAWGFFSLQTPKRGSWQETLPASGGRAWVTEVSQSAYGHRARKRTWLYFVGNSRPPPLDWHEPKGTAWVGNDGSANAKPMLSKREASATPVAFRDALLELAWASRGERWRSLVEVAR